MKKKLAPKYQELVHQETAQLFQKHFEGAGSLPMIFAIPYIFLALGLCILFSGKIEITEIWVVIIPTLGVPILGAVLVTWAIFVWYRSKSEAQEKLFRKQEQDANKFT